MELASITIRKARASDADEIARVEVEAWGDAYPTLIPHEHLARRLDAGLRSAYWRRRLAAPETGVSWVASAERSGRIAGYATCGPCRLGLPPFEGELFEIYLATDCQGLGLGRRLIAAVAGHFLGQGVGSMCVEVLQGNANRFFYEALGARLAGRGMHPYAGIDLPTFIYGWDDLSRLGARGRTAAKE